MLKQYFLVLGLLLSFQLSSQVFKSIDGLTPGTLGAVLTDSEKNTLTDLKLTGTIDARDFNVLKYIFTLKNLDLSGVNIVEYSGTGGTLTYQTIYPPGEMPVSTFADRTVLSTVILPATLNSIGSSCFSGSGITAVNIPSTVTRIRGYAFNNCSKLKSVIIENAPVVIDEMVFYSCKVLSQLALGNAVSAIGGSSFSLCAALTEVTLPESLTTLGTWAFNNCQALQTVYWNASVNTIPEYCFDYCQNLKKIVFNDKLETISQLAFRDCKSLTEMNLPSSLKNIGTNAFSNCKSLPQIIIPKSVENIGSGAFWGCTSAKKLSLYYTVKNLDDGTFNQCTGLDTIIVKAYKPISTVSTSPYMGYTLFSNVKVNTCVLRVPFKAGALYRKTKYWKDFIKIEEDSTGVYPQQDSIYAAPGPDVKGNVNLTNKGSWKAESETDWVHLISQNSGDGNGVISYALDDNTNVNTRIGKIRLYDSDSIMQYIVFIQLGKQQIIPVTPGTLSQKISKEEKKLVANIKLTGLMDARDFLVIRDSMPVLTALDLREVGIAAYNGNQGTSQNYNYVYGADEIPENAFYTNIGGMGKASLKMLLLPYQLKTIRSQAFMNCSSLPEIFIPKLVNKIDYSAFSGCTGLKLLYVNNRIPPSIEASSGVFDKIDMNLCTLKVPFGSRALYQKATGWKDFILTEESNEYLQLNADTLFLDVYSGDSVRFPIHSNVSWKTTEDADWLSIKNPEGSNMDSLFVQAIPNPFLTERKTLVRFDFGGPEPEYLVVVQKGKTPEITATVNKLKDQFAGIDKKNLRNLILKGELDARDFKFIRDSLPALEMLDLKAVTIKAFTGNGGTHYFTGNIQYPANELPSYAFYNYSESKAMTGLKEVHLPENLTAIGISAFQNVSGMKSISLPSSLQIIKGGAFQYCSSINSVYLPSGVKQLELAAFYRCSSLEEVIIDGGITKIGNMAFAQDSKLKRIKMPEGLMEIEPSAFENCSSLDSVVLPSSLKKIGNLSFRSCSKLSAISIPSTLTTIEASAFLECYTLQSIQLPASLKVIEEGLFHDCTSLKQVMIPDSVQHIRKDAFNNCTSLQYITLPQGLKTIANGAFYGSGLISIVVPDSVTDIGTAFYYCRYLKNIQLSSSLKQLSSFDNCYSLESITIPYGVVSLGSGAFQTCDKLKSITIDGVLPPLVSGTYTFNQVNKGACVINVGYKSKTLYQQANGWKEFTNITERQEGLFFNTNQFNFPADRIVVKEMEVFSTSDWDLKTYAAWVHVERTNNGGKNMLKISTDINSGIIGRETRVDLQDATGRKYRFYVNQDAGRKFVTCSSGTLVGKITPAEKKLISYMTISGTMDARDFKILRDSMPYLESLDLYDVTITEYKGFVDLDPDRWGFSYTYYASAIPASSFYNRTNLREVILPKNISKIENRAFYGTNLQTVRIPDKVIIVEKYAFYACPNLKKAYIGPSVTNIGYDCFAFNYALQSIIAFPANPVMLKSADEVFYGVSSSCKLSVYNQSVTRYQAADIWKNFSINILPDMQVANDTLIIENPYQSEANLNLKSELPYTVKTFIPWITATSDTLPASTSSVSLDLTSNNSFRSRKARILLCTKDYDLKEIMLIQQGEVKTIQTDSAGMVSKLVKPDETEKLKIQGKIDARDFKYLRDNQPILKWLDLSPSQVVAYQGKSGTTDTLAYFPEKSIPNDAFYIKKTTQVLLDSIYLPDSVNAVGENAFRNSKLMKSIHLPATITGFGERVFSGCVSLAAINLRAVSPPDVCADTGLVDQVNLQKCILYVPEGTIPDYQLACVWKDFLQIRERDFRDDVIDLSAGKNEISIYPNPVDAWFKITDVEGIIKIRLMTLNGQIVAEKHQMSEEIMQVRDLKTGVYLVQIIQNQNIKTVRMLKK